MIGVAIAAKVVFIVVVLILLFGATGVIRFLFMDKTPILIASGILLFIILLFRRKG
jgi:hypothetical protein